MLLKKLLPEENTLPKSQYEVKKILCPVGMKYQKIHACPNDCILYRNEYAEIALRKLNKETKNVKGRIR